MKHNKKLQQVERLIEKSNFDEAEKILKELLDQSPKDPTLLLHAAVHAFEQKQWDRSMEFIDKALEMNEDNPVFHLAKGEIFYALKQYDQSIDCLHRSLQLSPDNPKTEYLLGLNCVALDRQEEAAQHFEKVARDDQHFLLGRLLAIGESWMQKQA